MKGILTGVIVAVLAATASAAAALYLGWIDVAADKPHSPAVHALIEFARERSIARQTRDLLPPGDIDGVERIRRGAGNYDAMCADCHRAPGVGESEIRRGLYPHPPDLTRAAAGLPPDRAAARRFWIIKHGIKASGMPAWSKGGMDDADIWDMTAFLGALPTLSAQQYRLQVAASGGHMHGGRPQQDMPKPPAKGRAHDHSSHAH